MSLTETIESAVDQVFTAAGDLVKVGLLAEDNVSGFNFNTGQNISSEQNYAVEFIEVSSVLDGELNVVKEIVIRTKDLDGSRYSTLSYNSKLYRFEKIQEFPGVTQLTVRSV